MSRSPEKHQDRHEERLEVTVSVDVGVVIDGHFPKHLRGEKENLVVSRTTTVQKQHLGGASPACR